MEHRSLAPDLIVSDDNDACGNQRAGESAPDVAPQELRKEKQMGGPVNCNDSELSIYLQALAEGFLPTYYSDTSQYVQSKSMSIASRSYQRGKKTVVFHGFPSLQMSQNLMDEIGAELLTWFLADSHARTSASPGKAQASAENDPGCGPTWRGSLARFDPTTSSWRTAQPSLLEDSDECSVTWPRSGMTANGRCWELPMLVRRTNAIDSGLWPTPTVCGNYNRKGASATSGDGLATAVKNWPTPQASDNRNRGTNQTPAIARRIDAGKQVMLSMCMDGPLNPTWVEKLMGWVDDWTSLDPISHSRLLAHHGQAAWKAGSWEDAIPRVATGVAHRVDRLRAIGNGQVPLCAAVAWKLLTKEPTK